MTLAMQPTTATLLSTISADPTAAEFLLALLSTAAFSPRFASLLPPLPLPYFDPTTDQPNISLLRSDLRSLLPLHSLCSPISPRLRTLLTYLLFYPSSTTPYLSTTHTPHNIPSSEQSPHRIACRFLVSSPPLVTTFPSRVTAFHGSAPVNWHSILHSGLRISPEQFGAAHGRLFGDALYLSSSFPLALAFAPHHPMKRIRACRRIVSASVVGEFEVRHSAVVSAQHIPEEYVVVRGARDVRLHALCVLIEMQRGRLPADGWRDAAVQWAQGRVGGIGLVLLVYVVMLVWAAVR